MKFKLLGCVLNSIENGCIGGILGCAVLFVIKLGEKSMLENFNSLAAFGIWFLVMFQYHW